MSEVLIPKAGTLERLMLDQMMEHECGVTYMDFLGTAITEENIDTVAQNLRNGMYEAENDNELEPDA